MSSTTGIAWTPDQTSFRVAAQIASIKRDLAALYRGEEWARFKFLVDTIAGRDHYRREWVDRREDYVVQMKRLERRWKDKQLAEDERVEKAIARLERRAEREEGGWAGKRRKVEGDNETARRVF